jgi:hypothetical protein
MTKFYQCICLMSNQYGDFTISKKVFIGQCAGQKTQMLRVSYENTYIIQLNLGV